MPWKRNLIVLSAVQVLAMAGMSMVIPFLPYFITDLGVTDEAAQRWWAGIVLGVPMFLAAVMGPVWGTVGDRWGRKAMIVRAIVGTGTMILCMGFVTNVYQLAVLRVIQGALGGFVSASITLVAALTPRERNGVAVGAIMGSVFAGNAVGPLVGGALADWFGYRAVFWITGSILLAAALATMALVREPRMIHEPGKEPRLLHTLSAFFHSPALLAISGALFAVQASVMMAAPVLSLFIRDNIGVMGNLNAKTGLVFAVTNIVTAISAPTWGHLADRWSHRSVLLWCVLFTAVFLPLQAAVSSLAMLIVVRVMVGCFSGGIVPTSRALISRSVPQHRLGGLYGAANAAVLLGNAVGPVVGGSFAAAFGNKMTFVLSGVCLLGAFVVTYRLIPGGTGKAGWSGEAAEEVT